MGDRNFSRSWQAPIVVIIAVLSIGADPNTDTEWVQTKGTCGVNAVTSDACDGLRAWLEKTNKESRTFGQANAVLAMTNRAEYTRRLTVLRARIAEANSLLTRAEPVLARLAYVQTKGECGASAPTAESCDALREWFDGVQAAKRNQQALYGSLPGAAPAPGEQRLAGTFGQAAAPAVPGEQFLPDAQATLTQAEPALLRLREARDWPGLDLRRCALAVGPAAGDVRQACAPARQFLAAYPSSPHAQEVHAVLDPAEQRAIVLDVKEQKQQAAVQAAQIRAKEACERRLNDLASQRYAVLAQRCVKQFPNRTEPTFTACLRQAQTDSLVFENCFPSH